MRENKPYQVPTQDVGEEEQKTTELIVNLMEMITN
jgi:hypothetical protein